MERDHQITSARQAITSGWILRNFRCVNTFFLSVSAHAHGALQGLERHRRKAQATRGEDAGPRKSGRRPTWNPTSTGMGLRPSTATALRGSVVLRAPRLDTRWAPSTSAWAGACHLAGNGAPKL